MSKPPALIDKRCIIPKGVTFGDRRFRYKAFWCMTPAEQAAARARYPHTAPGIPDSAYAYPIDKDGKAPSGRASRTLLWRIDHVKKQVGKHRAAALAGAHTRSRKRKQRQ